MIMRLAITSLFLAPAIAVASSFSTVKQFEETRCDLQDVDLIDTTAGWAVGAPHWDQQRKTYVGTIINTNDGGATWSTQNAPVAETLRGVDFVDSYHGWAVGEAGTIVHTSDGGDTWQTVDSTAWSDLRGFSFTPSGKGWVVGDRGSIVMITNEEPPPSMRRSRGPIGAP